MESKHKCQQCGKPTEPNGLDGLCPRCMMKVGIGSYSNPPEGPASQGFVPPAIKDLVPLFPDLEVLELIGKGGMGVVYKARQKHLDRIVALKILPPGIGAEPAFAERLTREARALARLNHPGVVTLYESGCADGLYFFLMEFVDGVSLRHLLEVGRISPREALAIVPQICDALQYAHDQGIVHRDIKPENILLDRQGRVKVADFGLAKLVGSAAETVTPGDTTGKSVTLTEAGKVMGTPQYMAPEQGEHPSDVDHRADIYSLGVVFYQMLTGELPGKPIEPPSGKVQVDVRLDEVVLRALEKEPERRYQQVSQVKTAVETIAQSRSPVDASAQPADWMMWSPFQSRQVREICAHMTEAEKREATIRGALFSVWIVTTCFGPFFAVEFMPRPMGWFIGPIIFLVGIACFPVWRRMTREFLCTTAWARQQALKPDDLRYAAGRASAVGGEATDRRVETRPRAVWPWIKAIAGMVLLLSVVLIVALLFTRGCTVQEAVYRKEKKQIVKEVHLASVRSQSFTRLPQGEVELVGISFHPSANQPWWRSDGSPCQEGPFELRGGRSGGTDVITREFVIRLKGLPADASGPTWKLDPSYGQSSGEVFIDGQPAKDLHGITTSLPKSAREVTLKVGIGMGPWQTVAKQVPGGSNMLDVIHEGARWTASLLRPENTDSGAKITVVHTVKNREMRMLAVDHENGDRSLLPPHCEVLRPAAGASEGVPVSTAILPMGRVPRRGAVPEITTGRR